MTRFSFTFGNIYLTIHTFVSWKTGAVVLVYKVYTCCVVLTRIVIDGTFVYFDLAVFSLESGIVAVTGVLIDAILTFSRV